MFTVQLNYTSIFSVKTYRKTNKSQTNIRSHTRKGFKTSEKAAGSRLNIFNRGTLKERWYRLTQTLRGEEEHSPRGRRNHGLPTPPTALLYATAANRFNFAR